MSKAYARVLKDSEDGANDNFCNFTILYSPAFDAKRYQERMKTEQYADWARAYMKGGYGPDFVSLFSANPTILGEEDLDDESRVVDRNTLFEVEVFELFKN